MAKMCIAVGAAHLDSPHAVGIILVRDHRALGRCRGEARPAGAGVELGVGAEQRGSATDAAIHAVALVVVVSMTESPFRSVLAGNMELLRRKLFAPLRLGYRKFGGVSVGYFVGFAHGWNTFPVIRIYPTAI